MADNLPALLTTTPNLNTVMGIKYQRTDKIITIQTKPKETPQFEHASSQKSSFDTILFPFYSPTLRKCVKNKITTHGWDYWSVEIGKYTRFSQ